MRQRREGMMKEKIRGGRSETEGNEKEEKEIKSLDEADIALLKTYGQGQYSKALKQVSLELMLVSLNGPFIQLLWFDI